MSGVPCGGVGYATTDLSWIINFIKNFKESQEDDFKKALDNYMEMYFNSYMMDAAYDSTSKTIILSQVPTISTASHSLTDNESTLKISRVTEGLDYGC